MMDREKRVLEVPSDYSDSEVVIKGIKKATLSPFDVPDYAVASYNEDSRVFTVSFSYMVEGEHRTEKHIDDSVTIYIGKQTGKPYKIEIRDIDRDEIPSVRLEISEALDQQLDDLVRAQKGGDERYNTAIMSHRLAKDFLEREDQLYELEEAT